MSSWWMVNPGPKKHLIPTIKKKISTMVKLPLNLIIKSIFSYVKIFISKTCILELPKIPYHFLRYHNLVNKNFLLRKNHDFATEADFIFFNDKIAKCKLYLEYGSGTSTILADKNDTTYYSVESDRNFYLSLKKKLKNGNNYFLKDFGIVSYASRPMLFTYRKLFLREKAKKYANDVLNYLNEKNLSPDLILIDGRYRLLCALYVYKFLKEKNFSGNIIIDDYKRRSYLHVLDNLFYIKQVGSFGVCNKLKEYKDLNELIKIYENDFR